MVHELGSGRRPQRVRFGLRVGELRLPDPHLIVLPGPLPGMERGPQRTVGTAAFIGHRPEPLVPAGPALLDVRHRGAITNATLASSSWVSLAAWWNTANCVPKAQRISTSSSDSRVMRQLFPSDTVKVTTSA